VAHSFSINGQDMADYGVYVQNAPFDLAPATDLDFIRIPNSDRSVASEPFCEPRRIAFDALVIGDTFSDVRSKLDSIAAYLDIRTLATLAFDAYPDRYWRVWRQASASASITGSVARLSLEFAAPDAAAYAESESEESATFPAAETLTVESDGTARAWPEIEFQAVDAASVVIVEHSDLNRRASWTGTLVEGNRLLFRADTWEVFWTEGVDDDWTLAMSGFEGEFPYLFPGSNNIRLLAPADGVLTLRWRDRYL
jgi:phage-related protein